VALGSLGKVLATSPPPMQRTRRSKPFAIPPKYRVRSYSR
jgi:hypothetical protein